MAKLYEIKTKEGGRHWRAKTLLFDFITDNTCWFVSDKSSYNISDVGWDYACMEAFALVDDPTIPINYFPEADLDDGNADF